jgi:hypothetical protein
MDEQNEVLDEEWINEFDKTDKLLDYIIRNNRSGNSRSSNSRSGRTNWRMW